MKPRIVLLFGLTGFVAITLEGSLLLHPLRLATVLLGIVLTAGSANALNQYWDRDIDAVMERTKSRRPIPTGLLHPNDALFFGMVTGIAAVICLWVGGTLLSVAWAVVTITIYVGVYTIWLKRVTRYNIVIGGASGATAPLIGWAAATGRVEAVPLLMFLITFLWTPPHFWALSLIFKEDYRRANVPMLPVVAGEAATRQQILYYTFLLFPVVVALGMVAHLGALYIVGSIILTLAFMKYEVSLARQKNSESARKVFRYSIVYLSAVYLLILVSGLCVPAAPATELAAQPRSEIGVEERIGASVDMDLRFRDEEGKVRRLGTFIDGRKPMLLFLVYYGCPDLCTLFLNSATDTLKDLSWTPGKEFGIITVSIDPSETPQLASKKKAAYLDVYGRPEAAVGWRFVVNDAPAPRGTRKNGLQVGKLANSVGFHYRYDRVRRQFVHASAIVVLTPNGRISRYLHGIGFTAKDFKLALLEAGSREDVGPFDRVMHYCYRYDTAMQKYVVDASHLLYLTGGAVLLLAVLLWALLRLRRRTA